MVGHTLVELLVAMMITLAVLAAVVAVAMPASEGFFTIPEHVDVQQRLRAAAEVLRDDVRVASDGPVSRGAGTAGQAWPPVVPCGWGTDPASGAAGPCARNDVLSVVHVERPLWVATAADMASADDAVSVVRPSGCPSGDTGCEFEPDEPVMLADGFGRVDPFVTGPDTSGSQITHADRLSGLYPAGSTASSAAVRTYYVRLDPVSSSLQLRRREGRSDQPVLDHLADLTIEYFGIARPPVLDVGADGIVRASYGPAPVPAAGESGAEGPPYVASCAFAVADGWPVSLVQPLLAGSDGLAALPRGRLRDGPWCPDERSPWRFDLDLFRIRRLRMTVRTQAPAPWLRGLSPAWFATPGRGRDAGRLVPDVEAVFDVSVLGGGR